MAKGQIAKEQVAKIIADAFGDNFIGEFDKKLYVWANDGSEKVQIALAMTCPKTFVEDNRSNSASNGFPKSAFDDEPAETASPANAKDVTPQEQENIRALLERLGL
jgi:hypothetical protein